MKNFKFCSSLVNIPRDVSSAFYRHLKTYNLFDQAWIGSRECNPGIPNPGIPGIPAVSPIPGSRDWQNEIPYNTGLQILIFSRKNTLVRRVCVILQWSIGAYNKKDKQRL